MHLGVLLDTQGAWCAIWVLLDTSALESFNVALQAIVNVSECRPSPMRLSVVAYVVVAARCLLLSLRCRPSPKCLSADHRQCV